jgi:hypothetical protein
MIQGYQQKALFYANVTCSNLTGRGKLRNNNNPATVAFESKYMKFRGEDILNK